MFFYVEDEREYVYRRQREVFLLTGIAELLNWDEATNMPENAVLGRTEQVKLIRGLIHDRLSDRQLLITVRKMRGNGADDVVLRELEKTIKKINSVPKELSQSIAEHSVKAQSSWRNAKKEGDFSLFKEDLRKMVELKRAEAERLSTGKSAYESLMQKYEEGLTEKMLDSVIGELKAPLQNLLSDIQKSDVFRSQKLLPLNVDRKAHKALIKEFITSLGIPEKKLNINFSNHPFSTIISKNDVRITTRRKGKAETFFDAVHEAGHALYDLNLPEQYYGTAVYDAASLGLHESQSIFWENMICKNGIFWSGYYQKYKQAMEQDIGLGEFIRQINVVRPTAVRISADEVTYPLHIILRYEIEKELINGKLDVEDVRSEWQAKTRKYLGIDVQNDAKGILQDIHWAVGDIGYFPTYLLGSIYASQIYGKIMEDIPDAPKDIQNLDFQKIITWLRDKIHSKGKTESADKIIRECCGKGLDTVTYTKYLNSKYRKIYDI
jgi:carboxypeptidase Taq